jgi:hypothetical protein
VEPKLPDVLPQCTIGNRLLTFTGWMHYGNGLTISQIRETLNYHLQMKITDGGLVQMWHRLAAVLAPWYEEIRAECLASAVLHADETGWRVNGKTHWLWCFTQKTATYYLIDPSRGHPALEKFFAEEFQGVLITDFWAAYDLIGREGAHQRCWPHLLRELKEVSKTNASDEWLSFARRTRRIYTDAIKLKLQRETLTDDVYNLSVAKLERRVIELGVANWHDADAKRLAKRLRKYGEQLLTFLWFDDVPPDNNAGEREIRPAVVIRKNSYANQSDRGAQTQAILMSIFRTLKQRGLNPLQVITSALRTLATTGQLPKLANTS